MSLSKTLYPLLSTGSTHEDRKLSPFDLKIVEHQHKQITFLIASFRNQVRLDTACDCRKTT